MLFALVAFAALIVFLLAATSPGQRLNSAATLLVLVTVIFAMVQTITPVFYTSTTQHHILGEALVANRMYYTTDDGTTGSVALDEVSFSAVRLDDKQDILVRTCNANPWWLSFPLTSCDVVVYARDVHVGPYLKDAP